MAEIGHNSPPDMAETARDTARDLSEWMAENPVIQDEDSARAAKVFVDRGKLCIKDLEDEREGKVRPLNEKVKEINSYYKTPREILAKITAELGAKISAFLRAEEAKRIEAAREAARLVAEAERAARHAEQLEQDALRSANLGVLGIDTEAVVVEADRAFDAYKKAVRHAAIAEKETKVKIGGGFTRALSLRTSETLFVVDHIKAIEAIGLNTDIKDAILRGARAYRKIHEELPPGIEAKQDRSV